MSNSFSIVGDHATTTVLEAVNFMLFTIGEAPVNELGDAVEDARIAEKVLLQQTRQIQLRGWHWNREENYPFAADIEGYVYIPSTVLKIDFNTHQYTRRKDRVYDRINHTYKINAPLRGDVVLFLDFAEMPEAARWFCAVKAAKVFQKIQLGSPLNDAYLEETQNEAWNTLLQDEAETSNQNAKQNPEFADMLDRGGQGLMSFRNLRGY